MEDVTPKEFVRSSSDHEQPGIKTAEVPVIDLSDPDEEKVRRAVVEASRDWGVFQVVNHGIPAEVISKLQKVGREFFELPQEEKERYAPPAGYEGVEGYGTKFQKQLIEGKQAWVDQLFHKIWPQSVIDYRFWPDFPPAYREVNREYTKHMHGVVDRLFEILASGIGLEGNELKAAVGGDDLIYLLKINYYPPCPHPDQAYGVPPHTDMSSITILVPNEVPGLEAFRDGNWHSVEHAPKALIVHIGDQIEIVSNGKYRAVLHKSTVNKDRARISWPLFLEPPHDCVVGPHHKLVNEQNPAKYKTRKFGDYVHCKVKKIPQ